MIVSSSTVGEQAPLETVQEITVVPVGMPLKVVLGSPASANDPFPLTIAQAPVPMVGEVAASVTVESQMLRSSPAIACDGGSERTMLIWSFTTQDPLVIVH